VVSRMEGEHNSRRPLKEVESRFDEDHNLWEVRYVDSQGAEHIINWELASTPECRQLTAKFKLIEQYLEPPYVVEVKPQAKKGAAEAATDEDEEGNAPAAKNFSTIPRMRSIMLPCESFSITCWNRARRATSSSATKVWVR
jgi:hypothetical protein